jgi:hypothetical protein
MFFRLADNANPNSLASWFRRKRMVLFNQLLEDLAEPVRVLDIGGAGDIWINSLGALTRRCEITFVNLYTVNLCGLTGATSIIGDGRQLDAFADGSFDICFSNSVIEHVGTFYDQIAMAHEVRRVGKTYFIETPYRFFPLEPHFLVPGWQFLPSGLRTQVCRYFTVGWMRRQPDWLLSHAEVEQIRLLSIAEFKRLFPDAVVHRERVGPLVKSLIAIRSAPR